MAELKRLFQREGMFTSHFEAYLYVLNIHVCLQEVFKGSRNYYAYYHCYNGCKFRIKASTINDQFSELLKELNLSGIIVNLLQIIIKKQFDSGQKEYAIKQHQVIKNLEQLFNRSIKAKELFLKGEIEDDDFRIFLVKNKLLTLSMFS